MQTMNLARLAGAFLLLAPTAAGAKKEIIVRSPPTVQGWSTTIAHRLEANLMLAPDWSLNSDREGVVRVGFYCSEDGRPTRVTLMRPSTFRPFDRAAVRAVEQVKTLHPLPAGMAADQRYAAVVIFARTPESRDYMVRRLAREQQVAETWPHSADGQLAMVGPIPANAP